MAETSKQLFDRKFVSAAIAIRIGYALFMAILSKTTSPAVAGAAGVALTSVGTAIFKQFENLRFKELAATEGFTVPVVRLRLLPFIGAVIACLVIVCILPFVAMMAV